MNPKLSTDLPPSDAPRREALRITMLLPPDALVGGLRVISIYARQLAQRGHRVTILQPRHPWPTLRQMVRSLRRGRLPRAPDGGPSYFDGLDRPAPANFPVRRIKLSHAGPITARDVPEGDIVLATWWETAESAAALPAEKGVKVHFMQDYEIWAGQVERVDATCRMAMPKIVLAQWVANLLSARFGQEPIALIPDSVDGQLFKAPPRGKQRVPTVGLCYTPMHNKGTDISLAAAALARRQLPNLKVIAFGSQAPTRQLPLPKEVEFFHRVPDRELPSIYASCDMWLFGTRIEGFGLPILEAMACRTPVIGTPAGAAPELLSRGGGILVPMENPQAMAEAIVKIGLMAEHRWKVLSDAAQRTATGYTWNDAADRFEAALFQARDMALAVAAGDTRRCA